MLKYSLYANKVFLSFHITEKVNLGRERGFFYLIVFFKINLGGFLS
jgi:hypothetical protein